MKFREHRGSLAESMATMVEMPDRSALVAHIAKQLSGWPVAVNDEAITVESYGHDDRIGWDAHIVILKDFGPIGFTDGPV